jgi:hypothetical protein
MHCSLYVTAIYIKNIAYGTEVRFRHCLVVPLQVNIFADGAAGPTVSLASVAAGDEEDDDQSDSDYGKNVN